MDNKKIAGELVKLAKSMVAGEFKFSETVAKIDDQYATLKKQISSYKEDEEGLPITQKDLANYKLGESVYRLQDSLKKMEEILRRANLIS